MLELVRIKIKNNVSLFSIGTLLVITIILINIFFFNLDLLQQYLFLAFVLGLKHGFDWDHIATIDNITNYLATKNVRANYVGFYFSMGHSLSVFFLVILTILFAHQIGFIQRIENLHSAKIDILISSSMLTLLGIINLVGFIKSKVKTVPYQMSSFKSKLLSPFNKFINKPWHTFPVGVVFGLGFDTATEIALLGITAFQAQNLHHSPWSLLILPINFALGMCVVDLSISFTFTKLFSAVRAKSMARMLLTLIIVCFAFFIAILQIFNI